MLRMMLVFLSICLVSTSCLAEPWIESTKSEFVAAIAGDWQDYEIIEVVSKVDDKRQLLDRGLSTSAFSRAVAFESKELFLHREGATARVHLGLGSFEFADEDAARAAQAAAEALAEPYFEGSKVLTRFVSRRVGRRVQVAYTESVLDEGIKRFVGKLAKDPGER